MKKNVKRLFALILAVLFCMPFSVFADEIVTEKEESLSVADEGRMGDADCDGKITSAD